MKVIYITEQAAREILNRTTLPDKTIEIFKTLILKHDRTFVDFLFLMFNCYMRMYRNLLDTDIGLEKAERRAIHRKYNRLLTGLGTHIRPADIMVADKMDLVFGLTGAGYDQPGRFRDHMYEDFYNRLEELLGVDQASYYLEETFSLIDTLVSEIEGMVMGLYIKNEGDDVGNGNLSLYADIREGNLILVVD